MSRKTAESRPEPWPEAACGEADGDTYCVNDAGHEDDHHFRSRGWIEIRLFPVNGDDTGEALDNSPEEADKKKPPFEGRRKTALTNPFGEVLNGHSRALRRASEISDDIRGPVLIYQHEGDYKERGAGSAAYYLTWIFGDEPPPGFELLSIMDDGNITSQRQGRRKHAWTDKGLWQGTLAIVDYSFGPAPYGPGSKGFYVFRAGPPEYDVYGKPLSGNRPRGGGGPLHDEVFKTYEEALWWANQNWQKYVKTSSRRIAANPYSPEGNPYNDPAPGIPDDMMDGPPMEEPVSDIPMTTRPRQMPSGGGEAGGEAESISTDPSITPEQEVILGSLGVLPLVCRSSGRKFAARISPGLRCACGKRDYDLQVEAASWTHVVTVNYVIEEYEKELAEARELLTGYVARGSWTQEQADRGIGHHEENLERAKKQERHIFSQHRSLQLAQKGVEQAILDPRFKEPRIEEVKVGKRLAMEFDPQFDNRISLMPEADMLPENDQFAVLFTDDSEPDDDEDEVKEGKRKTADWDAVNTVYNVHVEGSPTKSFDFWDDALEYAEGVVNGYLKDGWVRSGGSPKSESGVRRSYRDLLISPDKTRGMSVSITDWEGNIASRKTAALPASGDGYYGGHSTTVTPVHASEPGALDGYAINCTDCGYVGGYSLKTMTDIEARRHTKYMVELESRRASRFAKIIEDIQVNNGAIGSDQARRMALKVIQLQDGTKP